MKSWRVVTSWICHNIWIWTDNPFPYMVILWRHWPPPIRVWISCTYCNDYKEKYQSTWIRSYYKKYILFSFKEHFFESLRNHSTYYVILNTFTYFKITCDTCISYNTIKLLYYFVKYANHELFSFVLFRYKVFNVE